MTRKWRKKTEKKIAQWSAKESKCLVAIQEDFKKNLESTIQKSKLYADFAQEMEKAGFTQMPDQTIHKLKKLKKQYLDSKKDLRKKWNCMWCLAQGYFDTDTNGDRTIRDPSVTGWMLKSLSYATPTSIF